MSSTDPASAAVLISETRRSRGLSQRELAARAHTSQSAIARIESGDVSPTVATLSRLLSAMGCTLTLGAEFTPQLIDEQLERSEEVRAMGPTERVQSVVDILHRVE